MKTLNLIEEARKILKAKIPKEQNFELVNRKTILPFKSELYLNEFLAIKPLADQDLDLIESVYLLDTGEEIDKKSALKKGIWEILEIGDKLTESVKETTLKSKEIMISPEYNKFSLPFETKLCEKIKVTLSKYLKRKADIYFLADTTGSMSGSLNAVKTSINNIITSLNATGNDLNYGVGNYKDFPNDSYAFQNQQNITSNTANVTAAVNNWIAGGGSDLPEGQLYALDQIAQTSIGWRPGSKRIVVWFGDAPGHDPICSSISGLPYNITEASVIAKLNSLNISVISISTTGSIGLNGTPVTGNYTSCTNAGTSGQATRISSQTGGQTYNGINAAALAVTITNSILLSLSTINKLELLPVGSFAPLVSSIKTPFYGPFILDGDKSFDFDVEFYSKVPCGEEEKIFTGNFNVIADGELLTFKPVEITIPPCCKEKCTNKKYEDALIKESSRKYFKVHSVGTKYCLEGECCHIISFPEIKPCFTLHWGDSKDDELETHDTEVVYITVHNPIAGVRYTNLIIEKIIVTPNQILPNEEHSFEVVPDHLLCFGSIDPCGKSVRKLAFHLRNAKPGSYTIDIEYKICGIEIIDGNKGKDSFKVELVDS